MPTCRAGRGLPCARLEVKTHSDMMGVHARAQECTDAGGGGGPEAFAGKVGILCYTHPSFQWWRDTGSPSPRSVHSLLGAAAGGNLSVLAPSEGKPLLC